MHATKKLSASGESQHLKYRSELTRLYQNEYGAPIELTIRIAGTLLGAAFIERYTSWVFVWHWVALFFVLQVTYYLFLNSCLKKKTAKLIHLVLAQAIFLLILGSFVSVPVLMMASQDDALAMTGFCIFCSALVFLVRRSESSLVLTFSELGVFVIATFIGVAIVWARQTEKIASLGLLFALGFFIYYLTQNSYLIRQQRILADQRIERSNQSQKMEAIGKLAGGVAHDFNNSLTAIIGNLDLIMETDDPRLKQEFLDNARQSALHSAAVVSQLLIYARKSEIVAELVGVYELLENFRKLSNTLVSAQVIIDIIKPNQDFLVNVDRAQFAAAMLNLIKNGADAMRNTGQICVEATSQSFDQEVNCLNGQMLPAGDYIIFSVSDNGPGISDEIVGEVTEPFFTTKPIGEGSGMGLSMVAGFTTRSEGGLRINGSAYGTKVELLLPKMTVPEVE